MENEISEMRYAASSVILLEDSLNEGYFYILKSGCVAIQSPIQTGSKTLSRYEPGDTFGLVSALTRNPAYASLVAVEECTVARIPVAMLGAYLKKNRQISLKIISQYTAQLRALDGYLARNVSGGEPEENPSRLVETAECYDSLGEVMVAARALARYIEWSGSRKAESTESERAAAMLRKIAPGYRLPEYASNTLSLKKDTVVFVENEPADFLYVIKSGSVKISKLVNRQEFILTILREGEIFGEMAVLDRKFRNATALVYEDATILRLPVDSFVDEVGDALVHSIFDILARRIWYAYHRAMLLGLADPSAKLYTYLSILITDLNSKKRLQGEMQKDYVFSFSLEDLKRMVGMAGLPDEKIRDFLTDANIIIEGNTISVRDSKKIIDKVEILKNRERIRSYMHIES